MTKHGAAWDMPTAEYRAWQGMKSRCYNPNSPQFDAYGERGIKVCDQWRESFNVFFRDVGPRPDPVLTLDRIDNDGDYKPGNCRWATRREQARNRRNTRHVTAFGQTKPLVTWAEEYGLKPHTLACRLKAGWAPEDAITKPLQR